MTLNLLDKNWDWEDRRFSAGRLISYRDCLLPVPVGTHNLCLMASIGLLMNSLSSVEFPDFCLIPFSQLLGKATALQPVPSRAYKSCNPHTIPLQSLVLIFLTIISGMSECLYFVFFLPSRANGRYRVELFFLISVAHQDAGGGHCQSYGAGILNQVDVRVFPNPVLIGGSSLTNKPCCSPSKFVWRLWQHNPYAWEVSLRIINKSGKSPISLHAIRCKFDVGCP